MKIYYGFADRGWKLELASGCRQIDSKHRALFIGEGGMNIGESFHFNLSQID